MTDLQTEPREAELHSVRAHLRERSAATRARRQLTSKVMVVLCWIAILCAAVPLLMLLFELIDKGWPYVSSWAFYSQLPQQPSITQPNNVGGASNAILGTVAVVAYAVVMAVPVGVVVGVFLAESDSKAANVIRVITQTMVGAPSILMGLFAFYIIVKQLNLGYSALAGAFALAVLMLPVLATATEIAVRGVPPTYREAGLALGAKPSTTSLRIVLPAAVSGIVTGSILAISRAVGETAPVLLVIGGAYSMNWRPTDPVSMIPVQIYQDASSAYPAQQNQVWGLALLLVAVVFVLSLFARIWAGRKQKERR